MILCKPGETEATTKTPLEALHAACSEGGARARGGGVVFFSLCRVRLLVLETTLALPTSASEALRAHGVFGAAPRLRRNSYWQRRCGSRTKSLVLSSLEPVMAEASKKATWQGPRHQVDESPYQLLGITCLFIV